MSMTLDATQTLPLTRNADGVIRVVGSRVTLDSILDEFNRGASPEQIQEDFPSLTLSEIYGVIAYYLEHRGFVEDYLQEQEQAAEPTRRRAETQPGLAPLRERIRARRASSAK